MSFEKIRKNRMGKGAKQKNVNTVFLLELRGVLANVENIR